MKTPSPGGHIHDGEDDTGLEQRPEYIRRLQAVHLPSRCYLGFSLMKPLSACVFRSTILEFLLARQPQDTGCLQWLH
eukprot:3117639-Rhodomonas_salina.1